MIEHHSNDSNRKEQVPFETSQKICSYSDKIDHKQSERIWTHIKNWFSFLERVFGCPIKTKSLSEPPVTSNVVKTFLISDFIVGILAWFDWLSENCCVNAVKATTIPVVVLKSLITDAQSNAETTIKNKYKEFEKALTDCNSQDIVALAQRSNGDVFATTSFSAEDYSHQNDDARDYTIAIDRNGNVLKKIKIT